MMRRIPSLPRKKRVNEGTLAVVSTYCQWQEHVTWTRTGA
jgi:hypothetical protein